MSATRVRALGDGVISIDTTTTVTTAIVEGMLQSFTVPVDSCIIVTTASITAEFVY